MKYKRTMASILCLCGCLLMGCARDPVEKIGEVREEYREDSPVLTILLTEEAADLQLDRIFTLAEKQLGIRVVPQYMTSEDDRKNIIQGRLATGQLADLCYYNSGSLLKELYPEEYFQDLSSCPFADRLEETFREAVSVDGAVYGVPFAYCNIAGVVLYNRELYEQCGLKRPDTWEEFMSNCEVLEKAGKIPVIAPFAQKWCSQICYLADYYHVQKQVPDFPQRLEKGEVAYAEDAYALRSWEKCEELSRYYNEDMLYTNYQEGCDRLVRGDGGHLIMTTNVTLSYLYRFWPDRLQSLGAFGIPGDTADSQGITLWPAPALYVNKNSKNLKAALDFLDFYMSPETIKEYFLQNPMTGPPAVEGADISSCTVPVLEDILAYMDTGSYCTALEYQTSFKGGNCEALTLAVGTGAMKASEAAREYDKNYAR